MSQPAGRAIIIEEGPDGETRSDVRLVELPKSIKSPEEFSSWLDKEFGEETGEAA
tara:strand:- start:1961 stop:2125 length:165 start_codon:yes stop_codon:yes gene_type:complete